MENRIFEKNLPNLKIFTVTVFLLVSLRASSPDIKIINIPVSEPIDVYKELVNAVVQVESSGDTLAYNPAEGAIGAFQIRQIRIMDYNKRTGKNYSHEDCYNYNISKEIFMYYAVRIGYPDYESIAKRWNGSGKLTHDYWKKVQAYL